VWLCTGPARDQHDGVVRGGRGEARGGGRQRRGEARAPARRRSGAQAAGTRQRPPGRLAPAPLFFFLPFSHSKYNVFSHPVVITIRQLFLRPAACLTSTLLETRVGADDCKCSRDQRLDVAFLFIFLRFKRTFPGMSSFRVVELYYRDQALFRKILIF
jgi:hypothetical protein